MKKNDLFLSFEIVKRFALGNVSEIMSDKKLKSVLGGYNNPSCNGSGDCCFQGSIKHSYGTVEYALCCGVTQSYCDNILGDDDEPITWECWCN